MKLKKLLTLLLACAPLHAAQMEEGDTPTYLKHSQVRLLHNDDQQKPYSKVFNHTQQHSKKRVDNTIDAEDLANMEELTQGIKDELDTLLFKAKSDDLLLGALLRRGDNKAPHEKYVLSAGGLLGKQAHRNAHKVGYHLVQTQPSHIIPALLQWMQVGRFTHAPLLLTSGPICTHCDTLLKITRDKDHSLEVKKEGCDGKPFPWPMPPAAQDFLGKTIQRAPQPFALIDPFVLQLMGTVNQQQYQQVQATRNRLKEEKSALANQITTLQESAQQKEDKLNGVKNELSSSKEDNMRLENQVTTLQESARHHNETLNKAQIAHQNAKKKIEELEDQVTKLQQYDDAKENDQQKEETIQAQATRIALLEGQLQKLNGPLDKQKRTEWFAAAKKGDFQTLQQLYHTYQVDSNIKDPNNNGKTALMLAAKYGKKDTVAWLIQLGAQVDLQENNGMTALMLAAQWGKKETVASLIQLGAQVDLQIKEGWRAGYTALMLAAQEGKKETAASLIQLGAQVNLQRNDGWTALMLAAQWGTKETVVCLIEQGHAWINLKNKEGKTALALATESPLSNQEGTIAYLRRCGAK